MARLNTENTAAASCALLERQAERPRPPLWFIHHVRACPFRLKRCGLPQGCFSDLRDNAIEGLGNVNLRLSGTKERCWEWRTSKIDELNVPTLSFCSIAEKGCFFVLRTEVRPWTWAPIVWVWSEASVNLSCRLLTIVQNICLNQARGWWTRVFTSLSLKVCQVTICKRVFKM